MQVQPSTSTRRSAAVHEEDGNPVRRVLQRVDRSLDELEADAPPLVEAVWAVSNSPIAHAAGRGVTVAAKVCPAITASFQFRGVTLLSQLPNAMLREARMVRDRLAEKLLCWRSLWASGRCSAASVLQWAPLQQEAGAAAAADRRESRVRRES